MSQPDTDGQADEENDEVQPVFPDRGPNREDMVGSYLPDKDDWEAKSIVDLSDPAAIAALANFDEMFPEVDDLQPLIDDFLHHFLKSKTSVHGASRDEYRQIFKAMYGQSEDDSGSSKALKLVAADDD
jgi:hypothetical protein